MKDLVEWHAFGNQIDRAISLEHVPDVQLLKYIDNEIALVCRAIDDRIDLRDIIAQAVMLHGRGPVSLEWSQPDFAVVADVDPDQMMQVLHNVIRNASEAAIEAHPESGARVVVMLERDGRDVAIHIDDNGPGITEQHREAIFDPYFTTRRPGEAMGLGLASVFSLLGASASAIGSSDALTVVAGARRVVEPSIIWSHDLETFKQGKFAKKSKKDVADDEAEAFNHWNEDDPAEIPTDCAKCHSTNGYLDYLGEDGSAAGSVEEAVPVDVDAGVEVIFTIDWTGERTQLAAAKERARLRKVSAGRMVSGADSRRSVSRAGSESVIRPPP